MRSQCRDPEKQKERIGEGEKAEARSRSEKENPLRPAPTTSEPAGPALCSTVGFVVIFFVTESDAYRGPKSINVPATEHSQVQNTEG